MSSTWSRPFTEITASQTASRATVYRPPHATGTIDSSPSTSTTIFHNPNPSTPAFTNDYLWVNTYLLIHKLSTPSYRYSFILWIVLVFFVLLFAILHWTGSRGGVIGAYWSKWALRRRTWRKKHSLAQAKKEGKPHTQPFSFPSNVQMLSLLFLFAIPIALCVVGPDYIAPGTKLWDLTSNLTRREVTPQFEYNEFNLYRRQAASTQTTRNPDYTIPKAWWTAGGRTGMMAFALFPLVILFSLKAPPFAVFAIPFLIQVHFDKLARLHRWTGRLIWFITTVHVATWGVQLGMDKRGSGGRGKADQPAWVFVWQYPLFIYGVIGYVSMTALVILSVDSFRTRYYEAFYIIHLITVPLTLVFSALHFPIIGWWCWSALILWLCERLHRGIRWLYVNGFLYKAKIETVQSRVGTPPSAGSIHEKKPYAPHTPRNEWDGVGGIRPVRSPLGRDISSLPLEGDGQRSPERPFMTREITAESWQSEDEGYHNYNNDFKRRSAATMGSFSELLPRSPGTAIPHSARPLQESFNVPTYPPPANNVRSNRVPPPGYAYAQLLPGKVIRLRLLTPRPIVWAPGQHVLLLVPLVSKFETHPFTINGCYDEESETGEGRVVELIIRAKSGFTKRLWDTVCKLSKSPSTHEFSDRDPELGVVEKSGPGVLLKAYVDGPFGSSIRAHWGNHSTVVIITGGTGVTFGVSVLEYLTLCLSGRDGQSLGGRPGGWGSKGFRVNRIRFIWLVREFSHLQWCASIIRRCMEMVPASALQVDIFVSNFDANFDKRTNRFSVATLDRNSGIFDGVAEDFTQLAPPTPRFMGRRRSLSNSSMDSQGSTSSLVDLSYLQRPQSAADFMMSGELGHEEHILDYTNFDGEDDTRAPGEAHFSKKVQKEGKVRRAKTRKARSAAAAKAELESKAAEARTHNPPRSPGPYDIPLDDDGLATPRLRNVQSDPRFPRTPRATSPLHEGPQSSADAYRDGQHDFLAPERDRSANRLSVHSFMSYTPSKDNLHNSPYDRRTPSPTGKFATPTDSLRNLASGLDQPRLEIDEDELEDLNVVAEMARPGKPKLERILADEVERSRGTIGVACCGPASLNAAVRKITAAQINPQRVWEGDMRGMISLTSEEFQW